MSTTAFTLVTILLAFGYLQPSIAEITVKDLLGDWYVVAMIMPVEKSISCFHRRITAGEDDDTFFVTGSFIQDGKLRLFNGVGKIENSTELIEYEDIDIKSTPGVITSFDNGENLIVHHQPADEHYYILRSRHLVAGTESSKELKSIAKKIGSTVTMINQDECS